MTTITERLLGIESAINIVSSSLDDVNSKQQDWINSTDVLFESLNKKITGNLTDMRNLSKEVSIVSDVYKEFGGTIKSLTSYDSMGWFKTGRNQLNEPSDPLVERYSKIQTSDVLTKDEMVDYLRIVKDQDIDALSEMITKIRVDYSSAFNKDFSDKKSQLYDVLNKIKEKETEITNLSEKLEESSKKTSEVNALPWIKKDIEDAKNQYNALAGESKLLYRQIAEIEDTANAIKNKESVLMDAWNNEQAFRNLKKGSEKEGYTKDELVFLLDKAINSSSSKNLDSIALTELVKKIESAVPEKRYQLDLTAGDQKLSAFTDLSPEKFIEALLKARGTAI